MQIKDLIDLLKKYDSSTLVRITWEGTLQDLDDDEVYLSKDGVLLLDCDGAAYKKNFQSGQLSGKTGESNGEN